MNFNLVIHSLRTMRVGLLLGLLTILLGFMIGVIFGGFNDKLKGHLKSEAILVLDVKYAGDIHKAEKVLEKASTYIKRSHLHAGALGNVAVALIVLLALLPANQTMQFISALSLGLGSFGYSIYWLIAGLIVPGVGSTEDTKELLSFLAIPSAALCVIGVLLTIWLTIQTLFFKLQEPKA